jgi:hypothetical protein
MRTTILSVLLLFSQHSNIDAILIYAKEEKGKKNQETFSYYFFSRCQEKKKANASGTHSIDMFFSFFYPLTRNIN